MLLQRQTLVENDGKLSRNIDGAVTSKISQALFQILDQFRWNSIVAATSIIGQKLR